MEVRYTPNKDKYLQLQIHIFLFPVGAPIPVIKTENPSQEEIDALHTKYLEALHILYDQYNPIYGDPTVNLNFI